MTTQTEVTQGNHRRAVWFFWGLLIGATTVSWAKAASDIISEARAGVTAAR